METSKRSARAHPMYRRVDSIKFDVYNSIADERKHKLSEQRCGDGADKKGSLQN